MPDDNESGPHDLPSLRDVVRGLELSARKSLGQHFILDQNLNRRIARSAGSLTGRTIVEVGPGPGGLTRALLGEGADRVIAVERDERTQPALEQLAAHFPDRLEWVFADALTVNWRTLVAGRSPTLIVANLPYNIATLLLTHWLEEDPWPPWYVRMVLMFQKEVAERIVAEPGSKAYGRLAVISQWRTRPQLLFTLPPEAFTPPPAVASAIVQFDVIEQPSPPCSAKMLARVTAAAFGQRRKMLRQSLKSLVPEPDALLKAVGIEPTLRGEVLTVSDFARLAYTLERWPARS